MEAKILPKHSSVRVPNSRWMEGSNDVIVIALGLIGTTLKVYRGFCK